MTRSDVEAMWHENAQLRGELKKFAQGRRRAATWLFAAMVLAVVNAGLFAVNVWLVLR